MTKGKSNIIDIAAVKKYETDKAFLLDIGNEKPVWFPKTHVEDNEDGTYAMPEWMALDKGAI
jgi:hypothetical protein